MKHYRHGDVLIERVAKIPEAAEQKDRKGERIVLAYGEVTGHAHAIHETDVELFEKDGTLYLRVPEAATVVHEEHATIPLPAGNYRIGHQREYSPEAIRRVAD